MLVSSLVGKTHHASGSSTYATSKYNLFFFFGQQFLSIKKDNLDATGAEEPRRVLSDSELLVISRYLQQVTRRPW